MKKEDLFEILQDIDEQKITEARNYRINRRSVWIKWSAVAACLVVLFGALFVVFFSKSNNLEPEGYAHVGNSSVEPTYPSAIAVNLSAQDYMCSEERNNWLESCKNTIEIASELQSNMDEYYRAIIEKFLNTKDENVVCSPLNIYIATAVLAEVSGGNTRQQILDMLSVHDIETLRSNIKTLWESNYSDTPILKSLLGNSIWLKDGIAYNTETMSRLAEQYYASSFSGTPGTEEMDEALRQWTDKNTGGLLKEYTQKIKLDRDTVCAIMSTLYYKASWDVDFSSQKTVKETFHGAMGDTVVDMMHTNDTLDIFKTGQYSALRLALKDSGYMYVYLPREGVSLNDILSDEDVLNSTRDGNWLKKKVSLSLPKFRVSKKTDLKDVLKSFGVTDAFNAELSDFTPLTTQYDRLFLSKAEHAAMVEIDENGVVGAAYTEYVIEIESSFVADEEFIVDRPFLFFVTAKDGSILFAGTVNNIE